MGRVFQTTGRRARTAAGTACLLMLVAALENTVAPWAPFYVVYAALALGLPFFLGKGEAGSFAMPSRRFWAAAIVLVFLLQGAFRLIVGAADLPGMFGAVFGVAGARLEEPPELVAKSYLLFIVASGLQPRSSWASASAGFMSGVARFCRRFFATTCSTSLDSLDDEVNRASPRVGVRVRERRSERLQGEHALSR